MLSEGKSYFYFDYDFISIRRTCNSILITCQCLNFNFSTQFPPIFIIIFNFQFRFKSKVQATVHVVIFCLKNFRTFASDVTDTLWHLDVSLAKFPLKWIKGSFSKEIFRTFHKYPPFVAMRVEEIFERVQWRGNGAEQGGLNSKNPFVAINIT